MKKLAVGLTGRTCKRISEHIGSCCKGSRISQAPQTINEVITEQRKCVRLLMLMEGAHCSSAEEHVQDLDEDGTFAQHSIATDEQAEGWVVETTTTKQ